MKKCRLFLVFISFSFLLNAQVSLEVSFLPTAGDEYKTLVDNMPNVNLKKQGKDQYWDFSSVSSGLAHSIALVKDDAQKLPSNFDFDHLFKDSQGWLRFYKKIGASVYEVALQRPHPLNSAKIILSRYEQPKLVAFAPLSYGDDQTNRSLISFKLAGDDIPSIINKRLPVTADSIKISFRETRDFRIDAWGTIVLSYDRFDVLREEISSQITTSIEIYSAGIWSRINNTILDPKGEILGETKERCFTFYSDEVKEPIAKVKVDDADNPLHVEVRAPENINTFVNANTSKQELILSPNPTYGDVKLELMNLDYGTYNFEVFNVLSKKKWGEEIRIDRKLNSFRYNFSFLGKGTYLWAITDDQGVRLTTKRLVVITP